MRVEESETFRRRRASRAGATSVAPSSESIPGSGTAAPGEMVDPVKVFPPASNPSKVAGTGAKGLVKVNNPLVLPGEKVSGVPGSASSKNETVPTPGSKLRTNPDGEVRFMRLPPDATGTLMIARSKVGLPFITE